jgi:hypothetical protein
LFTFFSNYNNLYFIGTILLKMFFLFLQAKTFDALVYTPGNPALFGAGIRDLPAPANC